MSRSNRKYLLSCKKAIIPGRCRFLIQQPNTACGPYVTGTKVRAAEDDLRQSLFEHWGATFQGDALRAMRPIVNNISVELWCQPVTRHQASETIYRLCSLTFPFLVTTCTYAHYDNSTTRKVFRKVFRKVLRASADGVRLRGGASAGIFYGSPPRPSRLAMHRS